jgi:hydrogenase nickel incorporation protein HypB
MSIITIQRKVLEKNDEIARRNRTLFQQHGILALNLVSSPGAGKTSIVERTLERLGNDLHIGVVEGDVQTDFDAQRVARYQVPVIQIVTNGGCHLEARLVQEALSQMDLRGLDVLIIENVGNLVCPANYDLGEAMKVVVLSTTEGDDKPLKYPNMFRNASVLVINKIDLIPYLDCNLATLKSNALRINPHLEVFETSCTTNAGIADWCGWLKEKGTRRS